MTLVASKFKSLLKQDSFLGFLVSVCVYLGGICLSIHLFVFVQFGSLWFWHGNEPLSLETGDRSYCMGILFLSHHMKAQIKVHSNSYFVFWFSRCIYYKWPKLLKCVPPPTSKQTSWRIKFGFNLCKLKIYLNNNLELKNHNLPAFNYLIIIDL
jgi:hypothetical protein